MQNVKELRASSKRQIAIPAEYKKYGFDFEANPVMKCFINEQGQLVINPPEEDPIEKLDGMFAGSKLNPAFEGLDDRQRRELRNKMHYEEKRKTGRYE